MLLALWIAPAGLAAEAGGTASYWVCVTNEKSGDMTVIDPKAGKVVGTIPIGGGPEFLAADGEGTVWTNLFDKGAFVTIDVNSLKVTKTTPIEGCKGASSMAFDSANRRLFIGCHSRVLVVVMGMPFSVAPCF